MWFVVLGFSFYYLYGVIAHAFKILEIKQLIDDLKSALDNISSKHPKIEHRDFHSIISKKPALRKYTSFLYRDFSYSSDIRTLTEETIDIYNSLVGSLDTNIYNWRSVLNPFIQLKKLLLLPTNILRDNGIKVTKGQSVLINVLTFLITYFLTMFSEEIKSFILGLLK